MTACVFIRIEFLFYVQDGFSLFKINTFLMKNETFCLLVNCYTDIAWVIVIIAARCHGENEFTTLFKIHKLNATTNYFICKRTKNKLCSDVIDTVRLLATSPQQQQQFARPPVLPLIIIIIVSCRSLPLTHTHTTILFLSIQSLTHTHTRWGCSGKMATKSF